MKKQQIIKEIEEMGFYAYYIQDNLVVEAVQINKDENIGSSRKKRHKQTLSFLYLVEKSYKENLKISIFKGNINLENRNISDFKGFPEIIEADNVNFSGNNVKALYKHVKKIKAKNILLSNCSLVNINFLPHLTIYKYLDLSKNFIKEVNAFQSDKFVFSSNENIQSDITLNLSDNCLNSWVKNSIKNERGLKIFLDNLYLDDIKLYVDLNSIKFLHLKNCDIEKLKYIKDSVYYVFAEKISFKGDVILSNDKQNLDKKDFSYNRILTLSKKLMYEIEGGLENFSAGIFPFFDKDAFYFLEDKQSNILENINKYFEKCFLYDNMNKKYEKKRKIF